MMIDVSNIQYKSNEVILLYKCVSKRRTFKEFGARSFCLPSVPSPCNLTRISWICRRSNNGEIFLNGSMMQKSGYSSINLLNKEGYSENRISLIVQHSDLRSFWYQLLRDKLSDGCYLLLEYTNSELSTQVWYEDTNSKPLKLLPVNHCTLLFQTFLQKMKSPWENWWSSLDQCWWSHPSFCGGSSQLHEVEKLKEVQMRVGQR